MKKGPIKAIVKVETTIYWHKNYSAFSKQKKVTLLKGRSNITLNQIMDDIEYDVLRINGFDSLKDGVYELRICNKSVDIGSGMLDDWSYEFLQQDS